MCGTSSEYFAMFRSLLLQAFLALRRHREELIALVEMMLAAGHDLPCFVGGVDAVISGLRARLHEGLSDKQCGAVIDELVGRAMSSWSTRVYDAYQRWTQGVSG
jgi:phosphatidylinositol kinase/protein kinase (PI-3  family)